MRVCSPSASPKLARKLAEKEKIDIRLYSIIYDTIKDEIGLINFVETLPKVSIPKLNGVTSNNNISLKGPRTTLK